MLCAAELTAVGRFSGRLPPTFSIPIGRGLGGGGGGGDERISQDLSMMFSVISYNTRTYLAPSGEEADRRRFSCASVSGGSLSGRDHCLFPEPPSILYALHESWNTKYLLQRLPLMQLVCTDLESHSRV